MQAPLKPRLTDQAAGVVCQSAPLAKTLVVIDCYLESIRSTLEESLNEKSLDAVKRFYADAVTDFLRNFSQFTIPYCIPKFVQFSEFETQLIDPHGSTGAWANAAHEFAPFGADKYPLTFFS
jgi:hypothetical protein